MTNDILERLRGWTAFELPTLQDMKDAADEIERLRREIDRLNRILEDQ